MDEEDRYLIWVCSISSDVGAVNNHYHPDDYQLAIDRYLLYRRNPNVRVAKIVLVLYHNNGDTETILLKRHEKQ